MDTIAVYWEPQIKTYGISQKTGLCLVSMSLPPVEIVRSIDHLRCCTDPAATLLMISADSWDGHLLRVSLVLDPQDKVELSYRLQTAAWQHRLQVHPEVEMIYFHGPHFGHRYGIAHTVLQVLMARKVPLLTSACCAASVYLAVPKGQSEAARQALSSVLVVPCESFQGSS
jgi:aspartokinase